VRYGLNKQDGIELRKTEDVLQFNSALGYRKTHSLTGTTPQNSISTQFTDGYAYPNTEVSISKRFAPYIFLGLGAEYATKTNKNYFTYLPLHPNNNGTGPETSQQGAFGVKKHYDEEWKFNS
jgi:hypothetical protein